jgi:hypothetical protein
MKIVVNRRSITMSDTTTEAIPEPDAGLPFCCYIPDEHQEKVRSGRVSRATGLGCQNEAEYEIRYGSGPDDYTHACVEHVGVLLTDADVHTVIAL